ncbi:MAG: hypothetical protein IJ448_07060 [Oscillospiraceae bacterium]|nr:hypothetical protein [Oscillospiraceae bacterium]
MSCEKCAGACASCGGCAGSLELTAGEIALLSDLAVYCFLPIARRADDMTPFYPEGKDYTLEQYSAILQHLERKSLIDLDYSSPVGAYPVEIYAPWPVHGSMALTARGQQVVEQLDISGIG